MQPLNFEEVLEKIVAGHPQYAREAYYFVREALEYTQQTIGRPKQGEVRHVSGQELLEGIRKHALEQFGPMAVTVLEDWGIRRCEDFGEIVFLMVENSVLAKTEKDSREDFKGGYDFFEAFRKPFLPTRKITETTPTRPPGLKQEKQ